LAFRKIDLHVHTPKSACFSDASVTPEQIVDAALAAGLDAIAVTDHNSAEAADELRRAASGKGLTIFPGVELSTVGGHMLALFPLDTPLAEMRDFLNNVGLGPQQWGDSINVASGDTEEVLRKICERGGLAVAAHVERWPSGFLETQQPRAVKMAIHASDYLTALEITIPRNKPRWNAGTVRNYPRKRACIQGSDAHALAEIGRRPVYIRMESISLDVLREAMEDFEAAIRFPGELGCDKKLS
jgi:histidinol phosphatase-like PHP family hydrolase